MTLTFNKLRQTQTGFTYIEAIIGALILSVCLVPLLQAINDNLARRKSLEDSERNMQCLLHTKERVFAESFSGLRTAAQSTYSAGKFSNPTSFSDPDTTACPLKRDVYILPYDTALANPFATTSQDMVYVRVEQADGMSIATLAIKQ